MINKRSCTVNYSFVERSISLTDPNQAWNGVKINTDNLSWGTSKFFKNDKCKTPGKRAKRGNNLIDRLINYGPSEEEEEETLKLLQYLVCINDSFHDFKILALDTYRGKHDHTSFSITPFYSILADELMSLIPPRLHEIPVLLKNIYSGLKITKWYSFILPPPSRAETENFYLEKCMKYVCTYEKGELKLFRNVDYPERPMLKKQQDAAFRRATMEGIYNFFGEYLENDGSLNVVVDFQKNFFKHTREYEFKVNSLLTMESIYDSASKTHESSSPNFNVYLENFGGVTRDYTGILHPNLLLNGITTEEDNIRMEYFVNPGNFRQELTLNDGTNGTNKTNVRLGFLEQKFTTKSTEELEKIMVRGTKFPRIKFNSEIPTLNLENSKFTEYKKDVTKYFDLSSTEKNKKEKVFGLFAKKRLGDQCQAEVVKKINKNELSHGFTQMSGNSPVDSYAPTNCVLVTHDRMLAAYCLLRDVPFIYDNAQIYLVYKPNGGGGAAPTLPLANYTESTTNYLKNNILNTNFLHGGSGESGGAAKPDSPFIDIYNISSRYATNIIINTSPYLTYAYYLYCKNEIYKDLIHVTSKSKKKSLVSNLRVLNSIHLDTLSEFMSISNRGVGLDSCLVNPYVIPNNPTNPLEYGETNSFIISVDIHTQEKFDELAEAEANTTAFVAPEYIDIFERIYDSHSNEEFLEYDKNRIDIRLVPNPGKFEVHYYDDSGSLARPIEINFIYPNKRSEAEMGAFTAFMENEQERIDEIVQGGGSNKSLTTKYKDTLNKCLELMNEYNKRTRENYEFKLIINEDEKGGAYINYDDTGTPLTWEKWLGYEADDSFTFFEELINDDQFAELEINLRDNTINVDNMKEVENKKIFENMTEEERRLLTRRAYLKFKRMKKVGYTTDTNNLYDKIQKLYEQLKIEGVVLKQELPKPQIEQETHNPIKGLKVLPELMQQPPPPLLAAGGGLIVDPLTGKKHSINEKMGKSILKRYIKHYKDNK